MMQLWYRDLLVANRLQDDKFLIQKTQKQALFAQTKTTVAELAKKAAAVQQAKMNLSKKCKFSARYGSDAVTIKGELDCMIEVVGIRFKKSR